MSYAIIRNENHKVGAVPLLERHNERLNKNYSNKDIDINRSSENYYLKKIQAESYLQEFESIRTRQELKGNRVYRAKSKVLFSANLSLLPTRSFSTVWAMNVQGSFSVMPTILSVQRLVVVCSLCCGTYGRGYTDLALTVRV